MTFDRHPQKSAKTQTTETHLSPALCSLADLLFAHADEIPQGLYLDLMEHLKKLGEEQTHRNLTAFMPSSNLMR